MKRKTIKTVGLSAVAVCAIVLFILLGFQVKRHYAEKAQREQQEMQLQTISRITLSTVDSLPVSLGDLCATGQPMVIFYYHPGCELCQSEFGELLRQKELPRNALPVFVTFASQSEVDVLEKTYPISTIDNAVLLFDHKFVFPSQLGILTTPETFVYNGDGQLAKHFRGFVMINDLLQVLQEL